MMNKHASHSDMKRPQKFSRNRSKFSKTLEALGKWKLNHTQNRAKFFLDCFVYEETSSVEAGKKIWIDAETSGQRKFKIALCSESPPGFSRLFVKSDDALLDSPASTLSDGDLSDGDLDGDEKRISVEAVASSYNAILMHTGVYSGTYPRFRHDYFLLVNDVPTPKISRLPEMPGPHELNIGLLHHESGHYTVAVLKETMISTIETDSSLLSGYGNSKLIEGPCVCTFSTSTGKWMCSYVSLPGDLTLENFDIDVVLANDNSFWWVNLRCGILSYDIDQQQPVLGFIPLPPACFLNREIDRHMREDRCVGLCNGELRCVHVFRKKHIFFDYDMTLEQCEDYIKIWTWRNGNWVEDYKMKFAELWKSTTFTAKRLPKFVPLYPTIDPYCPNLVNFFLSTGHHCDGYAIGVDLLSTEIQYCGESKDLLTFMQGLEIYEFSGAPQAS